MSEATARRRSTPGRQSNRPGDDRTRHASRRHLVYARTASCPDSPEFVGCKISSLGVRPGEAVTVAAEVRKDAVDLGAAVQTADFSQTHGGYGFGRLRSSSFLIMNVILALVGRAPRPRAHADASRPQQSWPWGWDRPSPTLSSFSSRRISGSRARTKSSTSSPLYRRGVRLHGHGRGPDGAQRFDIFGHSTLLQLADSPVAVSIILAIAALGEYGLVLGGWSAHSTLPFYGSVRGATQMIPYELALGLSLVTVFLTAGTMSMSGIVAAQSDLWNIVTLFPAFVVYPYFDVRGDEPTSFDLPEAEGEIVAGHYHRVLVDEVRVFFLSEYINMLNVSMVATTVFLGGWQADRSRRRSSHCGAEPGTPAGCRCCGSSGKTWTPCSSAVWTRGAFMRMRYDHFMKLGWKVLIPVSLTWLVSAAVIQAVTSFTDLSRNQLFIGIGAAFLGVLALVFLFRREGRRRRRRGRRCGSVRPSGRIRRFRRGFPCRRCPARPCRLRLAPRAAPPCRAVRASGSAFRIGRRGRIRRTGIRRGRVPNRKRCVPNRGAAPRQSDAAERAKPAQPPPSRECLRVTDHIFHVPRSRALDRPKKGAGGGALRPRRWIRVTISLMFRKPVTSSTRRRRLQRPRATTDATSSTGILTALNAASGCELCSAPGRRDSRRSGEQHPGQPGFARRTLRPPGLSDQLSALHLLRLLHPGLPHEGADDDERVRACRPHARGPSSTRRKTFSRRCWKACRLPPTRWPRARPTPTTTAARSSAPPRPRSSGWPSTGLTIRPSRRRSSSMLRAPSIRPRFQLRRPADWRGGLGRRVRGRAHGRRKAGEEAATIEISLGETILFGVVAAVMVTLTVFGLLVTRRAVIPGGLR